MKKLLATTLMLSSLSTQALVNNGDFENWTGNSADGWTTVDSGISLSPSSSEVHTGSHSAKVTVNTATQSNTDVRQNVSITSGSSYTFSVWVKHSEGGVKARLYVDGYQAYSDPSEVNQWQKISYNYTANTTGTIEVGLRFYDVSGFDGSEDVYVDDYAPVTSSSSGGSCNETVGTLALDTDNYGGETSWEIANSVNAIIANGSGYSSNTSYTEEFCLSNDNYRFTIFDSYGDGICCNVGSGAYTLTIDSNIVANGGQFASAETTSFNVGESPSGDGANLSGYYASADGLSGYALKTELYNIIKGHSSQGYSALWSFYNNNERDNYFENDGSLLDIYSENPTGSDPYIYSNSGSQCGNYNSESDCYNREHSFPRSWFGGSLEPMNSDVHHIFASDGYVNSKRGSYPYGEVASASFTSQNASKLGSATSNLGYGGTVFEPIDEFKGDLARAYFYMATRYENVIAGWENNTSSSDAVLNGNANTVFEPWALDMLKRWHAQDPVSQKEIDRNNAAYSYQGNRNPFIDHPELVSEIWGN
jgi:endonuclease I